MESFVDAYYSASKSSANKMATPERNGHKVSRIISGRIPGHAASYGCDDSYQCPVSEGEWLTRFEGVRV